MPLHEVAHRGKLLQSQKPGGHAHTKNAITLRACTTSSGLTLQGSDLDIVFGMKQILKSTESLKTLKQLDPLEWPTVKQVLQRIQEENGENVYQGATLRNYNSTSMQHCKTEALADLTRLEENLRHRLEWSDFSLLRSLLVFVETQSWMKRSSSEEDGDVSMLEVKRALEHIFGAFQQPLKSQKINLLTLQDEIEDAVDMLVCTSHLRVPTTGRCGTCCISAQILLNGPVFWFCVNWCLVCLFLMEE